MSRCIVPRALRATVLIASMTVGAALCATVVTALCAGFAVLPAQSSPQLFVALRADGNDVVGLRVRMTDGFSGRISDILPDIARRAGLNLTYDPALPVFARTISVPPAKRNAAQALMAVAAAGGLRVRVSSIAQIVIDAAPPESPRPATPAKSVAIRDTIATNTASLPSMAVKGERREREAFSSTAAASVLSTSAAELRTVPAFVEPDLLRSVQVLPGVQARSDWVAGFNIRGGESDQTLVLLDGFPVYNPFHVGGVFSTFIDGTVDRVELHTGAMPAEFGGRLSGVLDVHSAQPVSSELHGTANISLISSSATAGRTFNGGKGRWLIGARRTYMDAAMRMLGNQSFPYHFEDVTGHFTHTLAVGFRLAATGHVDNETLNAKSADTMNIGWNNELLGVSLSKPFHGKWISRVGLDSAVYEQRASVARFNGHATLVEYDAHAANAALDFRTSATFTAHSSNSATTIGVELARQRFSYEVGASTNGLNSVLPYDSLWQRSTYHALFSSVKWQPIQALLVDVGARFEGVSAEAGLGLSPRVGLKFFVSKTLAVSAGGGRYTQWMHSLGRDEEPAQPMQFWVLSDSSRGVSTASDAVVGFEKWLSPRRLMHVGSFYKSYDRLLTPNRYSNPHVPNDAFEDASGTSYGGDLLLRQLDGGRFSGWLAYTFTRNSRTDALGQSYAPPQDRRHNLNIVGSWRRGSYTLGARANVASGFPVTPEIGALRRSVYDPVTQRWSVPWEEPLSIRGERNSLRLPMYKRFDASVSRAGTLRGAATNSYLSIVNVFNIRNDAGYRYDYYRSVPKRTQFPNFPIVPTVGVTIAY